MVILDSLKTHGFSRVLKHDESGIPSSNKPTTLVVGYKEDVIRSGTKIGTDVDEVKAELLNGLISYLKRIDPETFGALERGHFTRYNLSHAMGWEDGRDQVYLSDFVGSPEFYDINPVEGSVEALRYLAGRGYEIHAITLRRRHPHIVDATKDWIARHYDGIINGRVHILGSIEGPLGSKAPHCAELGLSGMVEDQVEYAMEIAKHNIPVVLLDKPWNQGFEDTPMITREADWDEAVRLIERRKSS